MNMESNLHQLAKKLTDVIEAEVEQGLQRTADVQIPTEVDLKIQFGSRQAVYCQMPGCPLRARKGSFWCKNHLYKR
jgi:hypothetical protein